MAPSNEADFMTFYEAVRAVGQVKTMPTLFGRVDPCGPPGGTQPPC